RHACIVTRREHLAHVPWLAERKARGEIGPLRATVRRQLNVAIVGADVDRAAGLRRFTDRGDVAVRAHTIVRRERSIGKAGADAELSARNASREVGTD